jgi:uroporphyrinogen decarboxylase
MNSRERVLAAINHRIPDRLPVDLGAMKSTGIMASAYTALKQRLGMPGGRIRIYDLSQQLAEVEEDVRRRFSLDAVCLWDRQAGYGSTADAWRPWRLQDDTPVEVPSNFAPEPQADGGWAVVRDGRVTARMPGGGLYFDSERWLGERPSIDSLRFTPRSDEDLRWFEELSRSLWNDTEYAILSDSWGGLFSRNLGGYLEWSMALLTDQPYVRAALERITDHWLAELPRFHQAVGERIVAIVFADDLGHQRGSALAPALFHELFVPYYRRVFDWIHQNTHWKVYLHSCGSVFHLVESLIDCGVDILNPVQTSAADMDPAALKRSFGDRITFWGGGCDTQRVLPFGTPAEVRDMVRERIATFAPDGGFVFSQVHNIQHGVPPENVIAMLDAAQEFGREVYAAQGAPAGVGAA